MHSDRAITFTSSSIGSSSSFSSSKSSLFALDDSQSDNSMPRGDISQYNIAASPSPSSITSSQQPPLQSGIIASTASTTQKIKRAFGKRRKQSQDANSLLAVISSTNSPSSTSSSTLTNSWPTESHSIPSSRPSNTKLSMNIFGAKKHSQPSNSTLNNNSTHSATLYSLSSSSKLSEPSSQPPQPSFPESQPQTRTSSHPIAAEADPFPPLPPPKPRIRHQNKVQNISSSPKSPLVPSTSIPAAMEHIRNVTEIPEQCGAYDSASEEVKERWRRSDSTMDSGHTVRPVASSSGTPSESRRVSAYLGDNDNEGKCEDVSAVRSQTLPSSPPITTTLIPVIHRTERPSTGTDSKPPPSHVSKQTKRRSLSLTIPATSSTSQHYYSQSQHHQHIHSPHISSTHVSTNSVPFASFTSAANAADIPIITQTCMNTSVSPASIVIQPPKNNNLRGRLAAWTNHSHRTPSPSPSSSPIVQAVQASTSSPSLLSTTSLSTPPSSARVRTPLGSDASQTDLYAVNIVRQMQSRVRSPSNSSLSNSAGHIRQAATSLTSNASAMALGLGKRAYEKVNKVWGGPPSSGSGSDTSSYHHPSPVGASPMQLCPSGQDRNPSHGPSAFNARRSPNSSGSWSIQSQSQSSRSSSERDGRDTPSSFSSLGLRPMGRLVRPPCAPSGLVFRKELWECVKDTRTAVSSKNDSLAARMIPALIYRCVQHLYKWGLEEEGLFRIPGRAGHAARLRNDFDGGTYGADYDIADCPPSDLDPHAVASVFKAYLRELPESILTRAWGPLFDNAINTENSRQGAPLALFPGNMNLNGQAVLGLRKPPSLSTFTLPNTSTLRAPSTTLTNTLRGLISRLPKENHDLLLTVVELIRATAAKSIVTKMPLSNLLLVFCPSLNMSPTLLRVLCDAPSVWEDVIQDDTRISTESTHNVVLNGKSKGDDDDEGVKDRDEDGEIYSDALSEGEGSQESLEMIERKADETMGGEANDLVDPSAAELTTSTTTADDLSSQMDMGLEISADEDVILIPSSRARENRQREQQEIRRLAIFPSTLGEAGCRQVSESVNIPDHSVEATVEAEADDQTPPHSDSTTSFHSSESMQNINSNSQTASQVSLLSSEGDADADVETGMSSGIRVNTSAARFYRGSPTYSPNSSSPLGYNYDKALPASPRTPHSSSTFSGVTRANTPPMEQAMTQTRRTSAKNGKSHKQRRVDRIGSFSSPSLLNSSGASIPSVVFPSIGNSPGTNAVQGPVTPTSLKKLTISLAQRNSKVLDNINVEEEAAPTPSPSKRMGRRPSLNLLFNMKHGSSGSTSSPVSPRSRTPTISGPILFQNVGSGGGWEEVVSTGSVANTSVVGDAPPVLNLEMDSDESSIGWEDVFRVSSVSKDAGEVTPPPPLSIPTPPPISLDSPTQPRAVAVSHPTPPIHQSQTMSAQSPSYSQPPTLNSETAPVPSRRPLTEYLLSSSGFFSANGPPASLPTPATVLAAAELPTEVSGSPYDETTSSDDSSSSLRDAEVEPGLGSFSFLSKKTLSPHISFQLHGSSFEEEDWANTLLLMASDSGKQTAV